MHAIQMGGCGSCTGFGTTGRSGIEKYLPSKPGYGFSVHIFTISGRTSSNIGRESSGSIRKPPSSASVIERPTPKL